MKTRLYLLIVLIGWMTNPMLSQNQLGGNINGEVLHDQFGRAVSLSDDGTRLAVGARRNDDNGDASGHVRVFDWNGSDWQQVGLDMEGLNEYDEFGFSVSLSTDGNRLAVGADGAGETGHVRVFEWSGNSWDQIGSTIPGEFGSVNLGFSVSLSGDGNRVACGDPTNYSNGYEAGGVLVYDWNGSNWVQAGSGIYGNSGGDFCGRTVSLSNNGNVLAIGAPTNNGNGNNSGQVRIFEWTGNDWAQMGEDLFGQSTIDWFGTSVSLSDDGSRIAVGAPGGEYSLIDRGYVRLLEWNGTSWQQMGSDIHGEGAYDGAGYSVALSGEGHQVAIGAYGNDGNGGEAGHVRLFKWGGGTWTQIGMDIDGSDENHLSGYAVALSADGYTVAVGVPLHDAGYVQVFEFDVVSAEQAYPAPGVAIYPNPTSGSIFIEGYTGGEIRIINSKGQTIWWSDTQESYLDLSLLPSGVFWLEVQSEERRFYKKLIKL